MKRKFLCFFMSLIMIFSFSSVAFAKDNKNKETQEIYYDNIKYIIETKPNKVTITADGYDMRFEMNSNGKCKLKGKNVKGLENNQAYDIFINELNQNSVDIDVYLEGHLVEKINDYNDFNQQYYEGQTVAVPFFFITLKAVLTILVTAAAVIVVSSITHVAVQNVVSTIKTEAPSEYFEAIDQFGIIYINSQSITYEAAIARLKLNMNIYSYSGASAYQAVMGTGQGSTGAEIDTYKKPGYVYYWHYHPLLRQGAHAWYGTPVIG